MTWALFERTVQPACMAVLAEPVTFQPAARGSGAGRPFDARGIVLLAHKELALGDAEVSTVAPLLQIRITAVAAAAVAAGWPADFRPKEGDRVVMRGVTYLIMDGRADAPDVGIDLVLERVAG